jgi:hypothetical protein
VARGRSGAGVIRVDARNDDGSEVWSLLVKLSRDEEKLEEELRGAPRPGQPSATIYVPYLQGLDRPMKVGHWFAIASEFAQNAVTFHDWVGDGSMEPASRTRPDPERTAATYRVLNALLTGLGHGYCAGSLLPEDELGGRHLGVTSTKKARVLVSMDELERLFAKLDTRPALEKLREFVHRGRLGDRTLASMPKGVYQCLSHGDLHTGNILVLPELNNEVRLIDTGKRGRMLWTRDPARLCVDLWIKSWDRVGSYFWDDLPAWRTALQTWLRGDAPDGTAAASLALIAAYHVRDRLSEVFRPKMPVLPTWQFQLSLLWEFLLYSSYEDIPAPRRCLSLLAADDLAGMLADAPYR